MVSAPTVSYGVTVPTTWALGVPTPGIESTLAIDGRDMHLSCRPGRNEFSKPECYADKEYRDACAQARV